MTSADEIVEELLRKSPAEATRDIDEAAPAWASAVIAALEDRTLVAIGGFDSKQCPAVDLLTEILMTVRCEQADRRVKVLSDACFYYNKIGRPFDAIPRGLAARNVAERSGDKNSERLAGNALATAYIDSAFYEEACRTLERTLILSRQLDDPTLECLALSNTAALLKEMGLYQDAVEIVDKALAFKLTCARGRYMQLGNALHGLFSAHRLRDEAAALRYLQIGSEVLDDNPMADIVLKTNFEYFRALYLLHKGDHETADLLVAAARRRTAEVRNPRVTMMLDIAAALCDWASRDATREARARTRLFALHHESKASRLYHDDVLRALVEVHKRTITGETDAVHRRHADDRHAAEGLEALRRLVTQTSRAGVDYAKELVAYTAGPRVPAEAGRELVEFTTGVKNAKFYRQLQARGALGAAAAPRDTSFDPFVGVRRWLDGATPPPAFTDIAEPFLAAKAPVRPSRLHKHDELNVIHDDIAALRIGALKASMRTAAYDVAENWALAAEFFDDQTGEHCFRVGRLAGLLAAEIGIDPENCLRIEHAARLHDIGKIAVNEMILLKPGPLDAAEAEAMRAHTEVGAHLLESSSDATLRVAASVAKYHHAWWNGAGYPAVSGDSIPLAARICAFADVYDALTNVRPYKCAWPHKLAVEQMLCESGAHLDPRLMRPFLSVLERHVGSTTVPPSTKLHLRDMDANGLLASRRSLMSALQDA